MPSPKPHDAAMRLARELYDLFVNNHGWAETEQIVTLAAAVLEPLVEFYEAYSAPLHESSPIRRSAARAAVAAMLEGE